MTFQAFAIMKWGKYQQMLESPRQHDLFDDDAQIKIKKTVVPDPNNPAEVMEVALLEVSWQ